MAEEIKEKEINTNPDGTFEMTKEDLQNAIKLGFEDFVKATGITKVEPVGIEAKKVLENEHPGYAFQKSLIDMKNGEFRTKATMNEATLAQGGYLVPTLTEGKILEILKSTGQARQLMTVMPMKGNDLIIPAELLKPTAYWTDELASITQSDNTLQPITLSPAKMAIISAVSNELMVDANPDIGDYIMRSMAESCAVKEDATIFGSVTSPFTSLFYLGTSTFGATTQQSVGGTTPAPTYDLLVDCAYGIDQAKLVNASWIFSRSVFALVKKIVDQDDLPIFSPAYENKPATILGYPVHIVEAAPTSATLANKVYGMVGNYKNAIIGDASGMAYAVSNSSYVGSTSAFEQDLTHIRVTKRTAYNNGILANYSVLKCANS